MDFIESARGNKLEYLPRSSLQVFKACSENPYCPTDYCPLYLLLDKHHTRPSASTMMPKPGDSGFTYGTNTRIFNTIWPRQNGRHFADNVFKCIFLTENIWFSNNVWLKYVHRGSIENVPSLVQIMACRLAGASLYLNQRWSSLLTHTCVSRPRWVKGGKIINIACFRPGSTRSKLPEAGLAMAHVLFVFGGIYSSIWRVWQLM